MQPSSRVSCHHGVGPTNSPIAAIMPDGCIDTGTPTNLSDADRSFSQPKRTRHQAARSASDFWVVQTRGREHGRKEALPSTRRVPVYRWCQNTGRENEAGPSALAEGKMAPGPSEQQIDRMAIHTLLNPKPPRTQGTSHHPTRKRKRDYTDVSSAHTAGAYRWQPVRGREARMVPSDWTGTTAQSNPGRTDKQANENSTSTPVACVLPWTMPATAYNWRLASLTPAFVEAKRKQHLKNWLRGPIKVLLRHHSYRFQIEGQLSSGFAEAAMGVHNIACHLVSTFSPDIESSKALRLTQLGLAGSVRAPILTGHLLGAYASPCESWTLYVNHQPTIANIRVVRLARQATRAQCYYPRSILDLGIWDVVRTICAKPQGDRPILYTPQALKDSSSDKSEIEDQIDALLQQLEQYVDSGTTGPSVPIQLPVLPADEDALEALAQELPIGVDYSVAALLPVPNPTTEDSEEDEIQRLIRLLGESIDETEDQSLSAEILGNDDSLNLWTRLG